MKKITGLRVLSLFDGISVGRLALEKLKIPIQCYYASEIADGPKKIAQERYPDTVQVGDVTKYFPKPHSFDLVLAGSPCQGFSSAGLGLNFNDPRSKLFFEFIRIIKTVKPKYFFLENAVMKPEFQKIITDLVGVNPLKINSALVSPQNRQRLYWTNIPGACVPEDRKIGLNTIIGDYDGIWVYPRGFNKGGLQGYKGKSPAVTCSSWHHNFFPVFKGVKRKFTINEVEQIQTLPINYTLAAGVSNTDRYKACGNTWTAEVIVHLFSGII